MNKTIFSLLLCMCTLFGASGAEKNTSTLSGPDAMPVVLDILNSYSPWKKVEFSGKVSTPGLPVNPSLKIYMEKDSLIQISARVPFLGEVAKVHMSPDEILMVNKHNKTYVRENPEGALDMYPGLISDMQSLLLARIVILGKGELSLANYQAIQLQKGADTEWIVLPSEQEAIDELSYGYLVSATGRTQALMAAMSKLGTLEMQYAYKNRGEQIDLTIERKSGKKITANLNFESVKWGGNRMSEPDLSKYERVSISKFMKNF